MNKRNERRTVSALLRGCGAAGLVLAGQPLIHRAPQTWLRPNFRGERVSLLAGPLLAVAAIAAAPEPAALLVGAGTLLAGRYDDVAGARPDQLRDKGFAGHLAALRSGRLSSGTVKVLAIGGCALAAAALQRHAHPPRSRPAAIDVLIDGLLVAGTANVVNLLDLRPGRALKVVLVGAVPGAVLPVAGPDRAAFAALAGAVLASLPADLDERTMLGDAGANAAGGLLGLAAARALPRPVRIGLLGVVALLTAASERVSFSAVIDRTPALRRLDRWGRRTDGRG
jgi:UDP-N-acetylmuramyl pentapeptide phosphotransferase/UDP-N-acetylglucosamine-1-phosphate transferase